MSLPTTFTRFYDLPPELRLMIWEHALSGWSVFASGHCCATPQHEDESRAKTAAVPIGPVHHLAGLACRESRYLLEKSFARLTSRHSRGCNLPGIYWIDMDTTILYLDIDPAPVEFLGVFDAKSLSNLQHVAFRWNTGCISPIARACQLLAALAPELRTIIIQTTEESPGGRLTDALSCSRAAACYTTIIENHGLDCAYLRAYLLNHFADPGPKVHILPPATTNCSI